MKTASPELTEMLKNSDAIKALPFLRVDWNLNRYHGTHVHNIPNEEDAAFEPELFPLESIVEAVRPHKGINKARIGHSTVSSGYDTPSISGTGGRFYIADQEDKYKYWTSPKPAVGNVVPVFSTSNFDTDEYPELTGHDNLTSCRPYVEYGDWTDIEGGREFTGKFVKANKIIIKFENTWATPDDFDIVLETSAGVLTIPDSQLNPLMWQGTGEIILRWNGSSWVHSNDPEWGNTGPVSVDPTTNFPRVNQVHSIGVVVRTLKGGYQYTKPGEALEQTRYFDNGTYLLTTGADSFVDVIEISAHLEADLSEWLISEDNSFDMAEASTLYPVGTLTSNFGNVVLSNIYENGEGEWVTGLFSSENNDPDVLWSDYMEPNAEIILDYIFYDDDDNEVETVRQFTMFTETWSGQSDESVSIECLDYSKFFNTQHPPSVMWEKLPTSEIVWRLLDTLGFNKFNIELDSALETDFTINVFYTSGEETMWEVLDELARATQTAIYFDSYGFLRVKTRNLAYRPDLDPVWEFTSQDTPEQLSNVISLSHTSEFEPNSIKVVYQKTDWSEFNRGQPSLQRVWEPEGDFVTLRGTPLQKDLAADGGMIFIDPKQAPVWPWAGLVNINGEIIEFAGKEFVYYTGPDGTVKNKKVVKSDAERSAIQKDEVEDAFKAKSYFSGGLKVAEDEFGELCRGRWNTEPAEHLVDAEGYSVRQYINGTGKSDVGGFRHLKNESKVQLATGARHKVYKDILIATRGAADDTPFYNYGTKFKFTHKRTWQCAGIVINNSGNKEDGYFIEFTVSRRLGGEQRKNRGELLVYSRVNGKETIIGTKPLAIAENIEYEVDVQYSLVEGSGAHRIQVWVNGKNVLTGLATGGQRATPTGKFGLFARGKTIAEFEYLYAIKRPEEELPDDFSYLDKVDRGYTGNQWEKEWVFQWKTYRRRVKKKKWTKEKKRFNRRFFDDFGPYVHEIREFDVQFEPAPVLHSRLYSTNDWGAAALEYRSSPFGAKFIMANTSRVNSILHGEDSLSFAGTGRSVDQILTVFGRTLIIEEAEEEVFENADQIRIRGRNEMELTSQWIQSKEAASHIGEWIKDNFSYGNDSVNLEVFGNPLIEVGDIVSVNCPEKYIDGNYFVVGVRDEYSNGIVTSLTLRRRVDTT
jgi:hypothetical protein